MVRRWQRRAANRARGRPAFKDRLVNCGRDIGSSALLKRACLCAAADNDPHRPNQVDRQTDITD